MTKEQWDKLIKEQAEFHGPVISKLIGHVAELCDPAWDETEPFINPEDEELDQ